MFFNNIMSLYTFIIYAQILFLVLKLFADIMPHLFCAAEHLLPQLTDTQLFKIRFDENMANMHSQCANQLSVAYPSAYALQASMKANFVGLITHVSFLLIICLAKLLPSNFLGSNLKAFNMFRTHVFRHLKSMFVWHCLVQFLLGVYGNLHFLTALTYLLVWFFVEFVEVLTSHKDFTKSWSNLFTVLWKILCNMATPEHFFPYSHSLFLHPPDINKDTLADVGSDLQDDSSEMTLKCLHILPGKCNVQNTSQQLVLLVMDAWIVALLYLLNSRRKQRQAEADAKQEEKTKNLQADAESVRQLIAERKENSALKLVENLHTTHAALVVCNRLLKYVTMACHYTGM